MYVTIEASVSEVNWQEYEVAVLYVICTYTHSTFLTTSWYHSM